MKSDGVYSNCTNNVLIEDLKIVNSAGVAMGTVPANSLVKCIKGVYVRNIHFSQPIKAVYIKANPGTGSGIIRNITYVISTLLAYIVVSKAPS
ncbi:hypothetical protein HDU76_009549, partial [Blyttiomyces sp. JEL0837]